jgi:hypothetical protein
LRRAARRRRRDHLFGRLSGLRTLPLLSDYTWNHTTLWAMKPTAYTYLQCGFDPRTPCATSCGIAEANASATKFSSTWNS